MKSNKLCSFPEIAFLAVFPSLKIAFLKSQKMEFGQKKIIREIDLFDFASFLDRIF